MFGRTGARSAAMLASHRPAAAMALRNSCYTRSLCSSGGSGSGSGCDETEYASMRDAAHARREQRRMRWAEAATQLAADGYAVRGGHSKLRPCRAPLHLPLHLPTHPYSTHPRTRPQPPHIPVHSLKVLSGIRQQPCAPGLQPLCSRPATPCR